MIRLTNRFFLYFIARTTAEGPWGCQPHKHYRLAKYPSPDATVELRRRGRYAATDATFLAIRALVVYYAQPRRPRGPWAARVSFGRLSATGIGINI